MHTFNYVEPSRQEADQLLYDSAAFKLPGVAEIPPLYIPAERKLTYIEDGFDGLETKAYVEWLPPMSVYRKPITRWRNRDKNVLGILDDFCALEKGADIAIVAFIENWGVLGIQAFEKSPGIDECYVESLESYRTWAHRVRCLLNIAHSLRSGKHADRSDWEAWIGYTGREQKEAAIKRQVTRVHRQSADDAMNPAIAYLPHSEEEDHGQLHQLLHELEIHDFFLKDKSTTNEMVAARERSLDHEVLALSELINSWIAIEVYHRPSRHPLMPLGAQDLDAKVKLAAGMETLFWDENNVWVSVLIPIGMAFVRFLQDKIVVCDECGVVIPEPAKKLKHGDPAYCSTCRVEVRKRQDRNYKKLQRSAARYSTSTNTPQAK